MEQNNWVINLFATIGVVVAVVVTAIALVWVVCFVVKLLIKTFGVRIKASYDLIVEDITKKSNAKAERNEKMRMQKFDEKMELLNLKLESKHKIYEMKKQTLISKLDENEKLASEKYGNACESNINEKKNKSSNKISESNKEDDKQTKQVELVEIESGNQPKDLLESKDIINPKKKSKIQ